MVDTLYFENTVVQRINIECGYRYLYNLNETSIQIFFYKSDRSTHISNSILPESTLAYYYAYQHEICASKVPTEIFPPALATSLR